MKRLGEQTPRSVYVHVPFCHHRCGYCNFTLVAGRDDLMDRYLAALQSELTTVPACQVDTVFIGGGTPTHLDEVRLEKLLQTIASHFSFSSDLEFSVEANPLDVSPDKVSVLADHGVNRISLGVQSFQSRKLSVLERDHDAGVIQLAAEVTRQKIGNLSVDLIFGTPAETLEDWESDLNSAVVLDPNHLSTYGLTVEKGTSFWTRRLRGELKVPSDEIGVTFYERGIDFLGQHGFEHYEVSNFSKPGFRCRHNESCWLGKSYWAFGPGASRYVNGHRQTNHRSTTQYLKLVEAGQSPTVDSEMVDAVEAARERLIFGLRRIEGIDRVRFEAETGQTVESISGGALASLIGCELLEETGQHLRLTRKGLLVSDSIWPNFL